MRKFDHWKYAYGLPALAVQLFFIYAWISMLPKTDSFFSVYGFYTLAGAFCLFDNQNQKAQVSPRCFWGVALFSAAFSLSVILGNYTLFAPWTALMSLFNMGLSFLGGIVIACNILLCMMHRFTQNTDGTGRNREKRVFLFCFLSVVVVDIAYLVFTNYPAVINYDALSQFNQMHGLEPYSSWTPYWHTMTMELFLNIGYLFSEDIHVAVFFCEVFQILFIAACFAYTLMTLYQLGLPKLVLGIAYYLYVLYPYNIVFNVTIGKDVLFGVALLLVTTALLRILSETGKHPSVNYGVFFAGSLGFCLWRTNGWYVYLVTALVLTLKRKNRRKLLLLIMCLVLAVGWYLKGPYLEDKVEVEAPAAETMAVPFQQIARVIANQREIAPEDEAFLSEIFYLDRIGQLYEPGSVDPVKFDAFRYSHAAFFEENQAAFWKVWLRLGLQYPGEYLCAWIEETRGFWNGGYHMGVYDQGISSDNRLGLDDYDGDNLISRLFAAYFRYIEDPVVLEPLKSIGFVVWLVLACWWINVLERRETAYLAVPVLILLIGLWAGTPVFAEFRYAYPVFLVSPLLLFTAVYQPKQEAVDGGT